MAFTIEELKEIRDIVHAYDLEGGVDQKLIDRIEQEIIRLAPPPPVEPTFVCDATPDTVCGKKGVQHRMKRWNCYSTTCLNEGCNYKI